MMSGSNGHVHANVVELEPGHLVAFMRNREAYRIHRSESFDWGESWSEPKPTPLPNNNSSISAIRLRSGRVAIAYNPTCTPDPHPGKAAWPGLRFREEDVLGARRERVGLYNPTAAQGTK